MSCNAQGLLLCDDLLFSSKITGTAQALGLQVQVTRSVEELLQRAAQVQPRCILVDLQVPRLGLVELVKRLGEVCHPMPRVVGYGSHVEVETLRAAREAGCDPVWPRSKFVEELRTALPVWLDNQS